MNNQLMMQLNLEWMVFGSVHKSGGSGPEFERTVIGEAAE